jgi:hypothetical protein
MEGKTMIEILTVINTVAIIAYFILQIVIFRSGKPKMEHLTDWMEDTDRQINDLKINNDLQKTVIETLRDKIQGEEK